MKISALSLMCGAAMLIIGSSASAFPIRSFERAELFAVCSGRLAALAARQRGRHLETAAQNEAMRDQFEMLLDAVVPAAMEDGVPQKQISKWRHQGWIEIALYLSDIDYAFDAKRANWARDALNDRISDCTEILL